MQPPASAWDSAGTAIAIPLEKRDPAAGKSPAVPSSGSAAEATVVIRGEPYLQIRHVDRMPPFLMSVVSDSDFWLFVGSNGGFTAGRVDPDHAIFPYQTADRILAQPGAGGVLTLLACDGVPWRPWTAEAPQAGISRNLYKHVTGTRVIFEEIHQEPI